MRSTSGFQDNLKKLGEVSGEDVSTWKGYLAALRSRRAFFKQNGATATDHGHLTAHDGRPFAGGGRAALQPHLLAANCSRAMWSYSRRRC